MARTTLDGHPSVTIAHCKENGKLLMAVYDAGYRQVSYRFSANNIGGNPDREKNPGDRDPKNVLVREILEEYEPKHGEKTKHGEEVTWALDDDIKLIRDELVYAAMPFQDFLVRAVQLPNDLTTHSYAAIYSGFESEVSARAIEIAESNLIRVRRLSTEGLTGVFTLDELENDPVKGNLSTAHATAPMLNHFFGSRIPYPAQLTAEPIGQVRGLYVDYLNDFKYAPGIAKAVGVKS